MDDALCALEERSRRMEERGEGTEWHASSRLLGGFGELGERSCEKLGRDVMEFGGRIRYAYAGV